MTEQELYNEYRKSDCKSFTDFLINKIAELKKTYSKQRNKRIDELQKENAELKSRDCWKGCLYASGKSELIHEFLQQKYNLTKATEIIKTLLSSKTDFDERRFALWAWKEEVDKAKQFLNEVEK